jgi:hypothetical protein
MVNESREKVAFVISIIIYVASVLALSYLTDSNLFVVFIGTLPVLLYLIVFFYFLSIDSKMALLWVLPLVFPLMFLIMWKVRVFSYMSNIDGPVVAVLDVLISYVINIFVLFVFGLGRKADKFQAKYSQNITQVSHELNSLKSQLNDAHSQLRQAHSDLEDTKSKLLQAHKDINVTKENFNINLRSIEDKCKAINFVIGRVYSNKKGASSEIRDKLKIESHLYNSFSELTAEFKSEDAEKLNEVLSSIYKKIIQLESPEADVLSVKHSKNPAERNDSDRVIDVLAKNDKDPIMDYYSEAREICHKLMTFLNENYIKANTYFTN